ncbi:hypothetical protein, partial [Methanomethylovorans sp.]|uniref:hypothetical protein n=1 Tax=Methanomethylovorans sp. TaxID=2758717 RepID=UPI00351CB21C
QPVEIYFPAYVINPVKPKCYQGFPSPAKVLYAEYLYNVLLVFFSVGYSYRYKHRSKWDKRGHQFFIQILQ